MANLTIVKGGDTANMLEVLDSLRTEVAEGRCVCFVAVGLGPDDNTRGWTAAVRGVSRLRVMGALADLQHSYHAGWSE